MALPLWFFQSVFKRPMNIHVSIARSSVLLSFLLILPDLHGQSFQGLGTLDASLAYTISEPRGASRDGGTIVGRWLPNTDPNDAEAFLWRADGGMTRMDFPWLDRAEAHGVSGDGKSALIAGGSKGGRLFYYHWSQTGGTKWIGDVGPPGSGYGSAEAISANGKVIVGTLGGPPGDDGGTTDTAFQWTAETGIQKLGFTEAYGVSSDGSVVVGSLTRTDDLGKRTTKPYAWRNGAGSVLAESTDGVATAVSEDGKIIIGVYSIREAGIGIRPSTRYSFREQGEHKLLDSAANDGSVFSPLAVSGDGSVIVGEKIFPELGLKGFRAMIWTEKEGLRPLENVLTQELGLDLQGWEVQRATAVSGDGRVITGWGRNPKGLREAWRAVLKAAPRDLIVNSTADRGRNAGAECCDTGEVLDNGDPNARCARLSKRRTLAAQGRSLSRYPGRPRR